MCRPQTGVCILRDGTKGNNVIRLMKGLGAEAKNDSQKEDYVKIVRGGKTLDKDGNEIPETIHTPKPSMTKDAHIPKS